jgi:hypothetical protein
MSSSTGDLDAKRLAERTRRRRRNRLAAVAGLAVVGLALGAVYADSIPSVGGSDGTTSATGTDGQGTSSPGGSTSPYSSLTTAGSGLTFDWSGKWGTFSTDQVLFTVDHTAAAAAGKTFQLDLVLTNNSLTSGSWLNWDGGGPQLKIAEKTIASGSCSSVDFDTSPDATLTVKFDSTDAHAAFSTLSDDTKKYCFGVGNYSGNGKDSAGTFLRRLDTGSTPTYPTFAGVLSRTA